MGVMKRNVAVVILAAGMGTRMKSNKAKVLHKIQGRAMIQYVVDAARKAVGDDVVVVVGNQAEAVRSILSETATLIFAHQDQLFLRGSVDHQAHLLAAQQQSQLPPTFYGYGNLLALQADS